MYMSMYVCMYVCNSMYVCLYVGRYVCMCMYSDLKMMHTCTVVTYTCMNSIYLSITLSV